MQLGILIAWLVGTTAIIVVPKAEEVDLSKCEQIYFEDDGSTRVCLIRKDE